MERPLITRAQQQCPEVLFIGSPTLDHLIHKQHAQPAIGGAAFISALAARWAGASVGLVARIPTQLPYRIASVFGKGGLHRGGLRTFEGDLPGFKITYDEQERATYDQMKPGMESQLCAEDIPRNWLTRHCKWIHIAGIGANSAQQIDVLQGIKEIAPEWKGTLSAGTCRAMIEADYSGTMALLLASDVFFLNREEFQILCPNGVPESYGGTLLITDGANGVEIVGGPHQGHYATQQVVPMDPTGAGDSFCGGFIGTLVSGGQNPAERGIQIAGQVLEGMGADPLIEWVASNVQGHAEHAPEHIKRVAPIVKRYGQQSAFDFAQKPHLPVGHSLALSMLCISTFHQYGFWTADAKRGWLGPMYADINGVTYKGSDFIWAAFSRAANENPEYLTIDRMAADPNLFATICTADDGTCPVPDLESHQQLHRAHGQSMKRLWPSGYAEIVRTANESTKPVQTLLQIMGELPGYMSDPLAKKVNLLAVILGARPERFLKLRDPENIQPIVDYHMMRVCLRTGLVHIENTDLKRRLQERIWVDPTEELSIRKATGRAIMDLVEETGCSVAAIDGLFFKIGRTHCIETASPRCTECPIESNCIQETKQFQPVFRTTAY